MARILRFDTGPRDQPRTIDAAKLWEYVLPRLDFPLPAFIAAEIHGIITSIWRASDREINFHDCVDALEILAHRDILIPPARRERIMSLVFEYLSRNGFLYEAE
jgi:hypothetical protein